MAHEKVYATCENMCLEETMTKEQIQEAINNASIKDGDITTAKLADGAVTTAKLTDKAVTKNKLDYGSVGPLNLLADAVLEPHIKNGAVTADKLASDATCKVGSYEGTGTKQDIELGFGASTVIILSRKNFTVLIGKKAFVAGSTGNTIAQYGASNGINSTGFYADDEYNESDVEYSYVAFR